MTDRFLSGYFMQFIVYSGLVLLNPGPGKAWRASGSASVLDGAATIFRVPFRQLMVRVGLLELFLAFSVRPRKRSSLARWQLHRWEQAL